MIVTQKVFNFMVSLICQMILMFSSFHIIFQNNGDPIRDFDAVFQE